MRCRILGFAFWLLLPATAGAAGTTAYIVVQNSPLAGFRYYEGRGVLADMKIGDRLDLVAEPDNPHDASAVRVQWRGHILGYVPRAENATVSRQLARGAPLEARVTHLRENRNRSVRLRFEVVAPLQ